MKRASVTYTKNLSRLLDMVSGGEERDESRFEGTQAMKRLILSVALWAIAPVVTWGGVIYSTGFEPPTYSLGDVNGQDGWISDDSCTVTNADSSSGQNSLQVAVLTGAVQDAERPVTAATGKFVYLAFRWKNPKWTTHHPTAYFRDGGTIAMWMQTSGHWNGPVQFFTAEPGISLVNAMIGDVEYQFSYLNWLAVEIYINLQDDTFAVVLDGQLVTKYKHTYSPNQILDKVWMPLRATANKIDRIYFAGNPIAGDGNWTPFRVDDIVVSEGVASPEPGAGTVIVVQ